MSQFLCLANKPHYHLLTLLHVSTSAREQALCMARKLIFSSSLGRFPRRGRPSVPAQLSVLHFTISGDGGLACSYPSGMAHSYCRARQCKRNIGWLALKNSQLIHICRKVPLLLCSRMVLDSRLLPQPVEAQPHSIPHKMSAPADIELLRPGRSPDTEA